MLLFMGLQSHTARELKVSQFCKTVSEFALEYRTTREKVIQQLEKKATQRERKKTRGKMIVDVSRAVIFASANLNNFRLPYVLVESLAMLIDLKGFVGNGINWYMGMPHKKFAEQLSVICIENRGLNSSLDNMISFWS